MPDSDHQDHETIVLHPTQDTVVSNLHAPAFTCPGRHLERRSFFSADRETHESLTKPAGEW